MEKLGDAQITKIMVATVGTQDPVSPKTGQPTAPLTLFLAEKPQLVYLIPTADRPDVKSSSCRNAEETKTAILKEAPDAFIKIMPLDVSDPTYPGQVIPEMERIFRNIEESTKILPAPQFIVTPTSGTAQMREAVIRLLSSGLLPGAQAYEVLDPTYSTGAARIRPIELPPPEKRRQKVALFVDHENVKPAYPEAFARELEQIAKGWGDVEIACVGACDWDSLEVQQAYARAGFDVYTFPAGERGGQVADYGLLSIIARTVKHRPDIDLYIIASEDSDFAHGLIQALEQGKKVCYLRHSPSWKLTAEWHELMRAYPANVRFESIEVRQHLARPRAAKPPNQGGERKQTKVSAPKSQPTSARGVQDPGGRLEAGSTRIGKIVRKDSKRVMVDINGTHIELPVSEQLESDRYEEGQQIAVYLLQSAGPQEGRRLVASRRHPGLIKGIMQLAVPEVGDGKVEIKEVRRRPGSNSDVAVRATTAGVNAVVCCVRRIRLIVRALDNRDEKIKIVDWSPDSLPPREESGTLTWRLG